MHLRALIEGGRPPAKLDDRIQSTSPRPPVFDPATLATLATLATVEPFSARSAETIATVATVAALAGPESWLALLRLPGLHLLPAARWTIAADALESLMRSGAIDKALALGWDARELVGVQR